MVAVIVWSLLQLGLFWTLVRFCVRVLGFRPSARLFEAPHQMLFPVLTHAAITAGTVLLFQRLLGVGGFVRSPWFSLGDPATILACVALGMLPTGADLILSSACRHRRIIIRQRAGVYPGGLLLALGFALLATAFVEELAFRSVPLALLGGDRLVLAYIIPTVAFAGIHFLEARRARGISRHVHLFAGALFFFAVASRYGLAAATFAHAASNLGVVMIEGTWGIGSLLKIERSHDSERYVHNSIGYALGAAVVMLRGMA